MLYSPFRVRGCHPLWPGFPACSAMDHIAYCRRSYNPGRRQRRPRFGLLRVRSPLLAQSFLLSFPPGTKMFQFPGLAPLCGGWSSTSRVVPFGDPRVKGHLHLTAAFRSLSRPSSPVRAKASAIRPFLLSFARHLPDPAASLQQCCSIADAGRRLVYFRLSL